MPVFNDYSDYYDLFYLDKEYGGEARYVHDILQEFAPGARSLLNLGCGTGKHDFHLAGLGYQILGVDLSERMIAKAAAQLASEKSPLKDHIQFLTGDARQFRAGRKFDAVISMFHVASYQNSNADLMNYFKTASAHLSPGGIFVFDYWYGQGVLTDPPSVRVRSVEFEGTRITRTARPEMDTANNIVKVNYHLSIDEGGVPVEINEQHSMRYLFLPEISLLASLNGFEVAANFHEFTRDEPGPSSWNAVSVLKRKDA